MSILIKNMDLSDADLDPINISILSDGTVCDGVWGYVVAHAIELPPHGKLIDADTLLEEVYKLRMWLLEHNMPGVEHWVTKIYQMIDEAPIVIEADIENIPMEYFEAGGK